ncbi:nucleotidyltransferase family protein [Prevotella sp.]|jgi:predicted nucleotidyltransferase|uniref:nucleotidyltransferase family protein n=1 Tax=uncultured Prevotella sp. TaxID=159272 RepID=UPI0025CF01EF|nr:nucleotidyltransferase domain-containing protein [Prevotella sp.]
MNGIQYYITAIRENSSKITHDFGIRTLRIFGSVSRNEQSNDSDLDICVETEDANPFLLASLKDYLEDILKCPVDIVRMHKNMNPLFKSRIDRDGIYAIR